MMNILIRTSDRPKQFTKCLLTVLEQADEDTNILISSDNERTTNYVRAFYFEPIKVIPQTKTAEQPCPYNLYLNELLTYTETGFILILDDDDRLASGALETLINELTDPNTLYIARMQWPNGRLIPEDDLFGKMPVRKHIGMPCFYFHTKWADRIEFDARRAGDFRVLMQLWKMIPNKKFINQVIVNTGNTGAKGRKEV